MLSDPTRAPAAIDTMDGALAGWETGPVRPGEVSLGDETSETPSLPLHAYAEGFSRLRRGEYRDAIASFRRAAAIAVDERPRLFEAGTLAQQGRDVEAEQVLRAILAGYPGSGVARWWLARIYERLNRFSDARREYETLVSTALSGRAGLYEAIGRLSRLEGDVERTTQAYEQRALMAPNDPAAHRDLGRIHLEQGRTERALTEYNAAIAIDPRDALAHAAVGQIRLDAGLPAEAIASLKRAIELVPAFYEVRYSLALALKRIGRDGEAARELELFERARRESTEDRRRTMAAEVRKQQEEVEDRAR